MQGLRSKKLKMNFLVWKSIFKASIVLITFLTNVNFWSKYFCKHFWKPQILNLLRPCTSFQRSHTGFGFFTNLGSFFFFCRQYYLWRPCCIYYISIPTYVNLVWTYETYRRHSGNGNDGTILICFTWKTLIHFETSIQFQYYIAIFLLISW